MTLIQGVRSTTYYFSRLRALPIRVRAILKTAYEYYTISVNEIRLNRISKPIGKIETNVVGYLERKEKINSYLNVITPTQS